EMSRVQGISGATGDDFNKLEDQALSLGASTAFSANECAEGMEGLASAGFNTNEIMEAMPGTLDASASAGEDLASTTEVMTGTLRGFGLEAGQAGHVADVLARNAADTNAAIGDTGEAMKYVAPVAHAAGQSFEEVTAAVGIMADANIKGSQAGTTLRGAMSRLADPSKEAAASMKRIGFEAFDTHGKMLPLNKIVGNLQKSTADLTDKQKQQAISTIFGQEAMSGMLTLIDAGPGKMNELTDSLKNSDGAAKDMATTMQDNTKSSIEQAFGALETSGIKVLKAAAPAIKDVAEIVGNLADKFNNLSPGTQKFIVEAGMVAIAAGPVVSTFGSIAKGIGGIIGIGSKLLGGLGLISTGAEVATTATAAVGVAAEGTAVATAGAGAAAGGLGAALAGAAIPIAAGVATVAAVGYAGYKTAEYLNSSATPAVDLFADKAVYSTQQVTGASGTMTAQVQTDTIKISDSTKKAVGSYMDLDKKASNSLMDLKMNSDKFTTESKDAVLKNFTEMSKKSSKLSDEQKNAMTVDFKKLVSDTGTLSKKNKDEIIKEYSAMVNGTKNLSKKQKDQTIKDFTDTLTQSTGITKKQSSELQKLYADMGNKIKTGLDKKKADELKSQKSFFDKSNALTTKEEADILKKTTDNWENKKNAINESQKKIDILKKEAIDFIGEVATKSSNSTIDLISFNSKVTNNTGSFLSLNIPDNVNRIKNSVNGLKPEAATSTDLALKEALDSMKKLPLNKDRKRIVILITDGTPSRNGSTSGAIIQEALNYSTALKNPEINSYIYSLGIFNNNEIETLQAQEFMKNVA
ncbi:phage tail tape measure protein, partial [Cetobacterium sp.]|uniref:phage tail tape measure protein n=1 Tax=Cetobacterium sp. TaxID=2071632 RepID=UPI002FC67761